MLIPTLWKKGLCENIVLVCTVGAKAMTGKHQGLIAHVNEVVPKCTSSDCIIHWQALTMKKMPETLKTVIDEEVQNVNSIKARTLNSRLFACLCEEMDSHYKTLLMHLEGHWLSQGKALVCVHSSLKIGDISSQVTP